jgi:5'-nucleotidase/UDP-sugar diphosphatase
MKRLLPRTLLTVALILSFLWPVPLSAQQDQTLVILHTNDFHGHPLKFNYKGIPDVGGLPAIATFVERARAEHKNVLLLDAVDWNTGRAESNFFKAVPDILGYNYTGYDAMVLGNHEFDNPLDILRRQEKLARLPFLSANIRTTKGEPLVRPYVVKHFDGFKVGILGLTLKETKDIGYPDHVTDLVFEDEVKAARRFVQLLRNKADVVIALVHMGLWENENRGSKRLAARVQGIDLIVDGHTHTDLMEPVYVNGTPIVQAFQWGLKVGKATMTIRQGRVAGFRWESVPINLKERIRLPDGTEGFRSIGEKYQEDPFLLAALTPYADKVESLLSDVIGTAEADFGNENVRKQETELGNLVADSMLWHTRNLNTDFAFQNGGGMRVGLPAGEITKKKIYEILPFDNTVVVLKMKGHQVLRLFDYMATVPSGAGAFPQLSEGVRVTINSAARRSEDITINGKPVDPERTYSIATNSYLARGGDGYKILLEALDRYDTSTFQRDALIDYIINFRKKLKPELDSRIEIIVKIPLTLSTPHRRDSLPGILISSHPRCSEFEISPH